MKTITLILGFLFSFSALAEIQSSGERGKSPCLNGPYKSEAGAYGALWLEGYGNETCSYERTAQGVRVTYNLTVGYVNPHPNENLAKNTFGSDRFQIELLLNNENKLVFS